VGVLIVGGVIAAVRARGPVVATAVASRTDLEQHVIASGRVRVVTRVQLSAQISGRVVSVRVVEGRRVSAGDVLLQMDDAEARAAVSQARAAVNQASGRVEQLRKVSAIVTTEASRQAATDLARAESELARVEMLAAAGVVARVELDEARRSVEVAKAQRNAAAAQQTAASPKGVDSSIAQSALVESQARLAAAMVRLEQTRLVAPQDGVVLARTVEPGDTVQPGNTLLEIAADGETELVIEPDERNLAWIRFGQRARASADAYPEVVFDAEVDYIAPVIDPQRGSIEVRRRVPEAPDFLKPDMTVSVDPGRCPRAPRLRPGLGPWRGARPGFRNHDQHSGWLAEVSGASRPRAPGLCHGTRDRRRSPCRGHSSAPGRAARSRDGDPRWLIPFCRPCREPRHGFV
jgi:HlyD family secretion protein